jgi:hypothetical protein
MPTPTGHARCSASASHRWLSCTAAPTFEQQFPETEVSIYAKQGTLAHEFAELEAQKTFQLITKSRYNSRRKKLREDDLYDPEMEKTAQFYAGYLAKKAEALGGKPHVALEVNVDLSEYVPEGFGQCDCAMIAGDTLHITDYKHGIGVPVSAVGNSQMRLYALGALSRYALAYPMVEKVSMAIVQPRISEDVSEEIMTVADLRAWGESIKPLAQEAFTGPGTFHPGSWCRFCKGKAQCRARAEELMSLEAYVDAVPSGGITPEEQFQRDKALMLGQPVSTILTDAEVGDLLRRGAELSKWLADLQAYAREAVLEGKEIPGWKVVEGRSNRAFRDPDEALRAMQEAGYPDEMLYDRKVKTLTELEKLMGKKEFAAKLGGLVIKPPGKPTLVEETDKRPPYNSMAADAEGLK